MLNDDDGLPIDEAGAWAMEKHERLRKYVDISRAARRKFVPDEESQTYRAGASYIDLYCGWGRAVVRETGDRVDGSPLVAYKSARDGGVPFSEIHVADLEAEKVAATVARINEAGGSAHSEIGAAEDTVRRIGDRLNPAGLHFAFLDPYSLQALPFSVFETLSRFRRMDILVHVSALDLQRNLDKYAMAKDSSLDRFAPGWRDAVDLKQSKSATRAAYVKYWTAKMEGVGLPRARAELVSGTNNQRLYWLVFVSRSDFAKGLWEKIRNISTQRELDL